MIANPVLCFLFYAVSFASASIKPKETIKFLKEKDSQFHLGEKKDVVLILGFPNSGKTTLSLLLTDAELTSKQIDGAIEEYSIHDKLGSVIGPSPGIPTIIPNLVIDQESKTEYYDCPDVNIQTPLDQDITISYLLNKLKRHVESFKIVFVVDFKSIQKIEQRRLFDELVQNAVSLLKNVTEYREGIALVVTQVKNEYVRRNRNFVLVNDEEVIAEIASFLSVERNGMLDSSKRSDLREDENEKLRNKIELFGTWLESTEIDGSSVYRRIGILRRPEEVGPIQDMEAIQREKLNIKQMIENHLMYVKKGEIGEYKHSALTWSNDGIDEIIDELVKHEVLKDLRNVSDGMMHYHRRFFEESYDKLALDDSILMSRQTLKGIKSLEPVLFVKELVNVTKVMKIDDLMGELKRDVEYIEFLKEVRGSRVLLPPTILQEISLVKTHFKQLYEIYIDFLLEALMKEKEMIEDCDGTFWS